MSEVADQERWDEELRQETCQALLTKLRDEVEGMSRWEAHAYRNKLTHTGEYLLRSEVLALIEKAGGE